MTVNTKQGVVPALQYGQTAVAHPARLALLKKILCAVVSPATGKQAALAPLADTATVNAPDPHKIPAMGVPPVPLIKQPVTLIVLAAVNPPLKVDTLPDVVSMPTVAVILPVVSNVDAVVTPCLKYA